VSGLSAARLYYYRVRAYNLNGTSGNSSTITVTTSALALPAPPAASSATGITSNAFTANWSSSAGATGYNLDVLSSGGTDTTLHIGDSIMVSFSTDGVNARSIPSTSGPTVLKLELAGTRGIIVAGPKPDQNGSSSFTFWQITYSDGITGWSAGTYLQKILGSFVQGYNNKDVGNAASAGVSALSANTSYYYRVRARNANGSGGNSNTITVTTLALASAPIVATTPATGISITGMQFNGSVNPNGLATTCHFDYGTTTGYGQSTPNQSLSSGGSVVPVNAVVAGLTPGTLYHFRLAATNSGGPASGSDASATTNSSPVPPPTVATNPAASPTVTGAQLNGIVNPNGFSTTTYFEYGPTVSYGVTTPVKNLGAGVTAVAVSATVSGLSIGTLYHYRLVAQNTGGISHGIDTTFVTALRSPREYLLLQNYPNPFNPTTTIIYALPHKTFVALTVFNTLGQPIATLVSGEQEAGSHQATFDGANLSSGTYFYRLQTADELEVRRIVLVH
jgi:hypothetical protein